MAEVAQRYGPYTCVRRLGAGGMAETFLAVQHGAAGFEQRVCIKFMLPALRSDQAFRQMFLREATIAASLRHANIVGVVDVDEQAGYIVLELVDGVDLRTLVNAAPNRRLPAHVVSLIAIELCKALAYAHGRTRRGLPDGIVHRDISPANVLISHNGEVKLTDFGVAKAMHSTIEPPSTGIKGKLCYMSPEQTRGDPLDGRSDLFSLGVMIYELLAGVRPFDGPTHAQTLLRIESGRHTTLTEVVPDVPGGLALVVERMLRTGVDHRYPTADACIDALARFAPPVTTYRELGQLARSARPPVTLSSMEFGMATPGSGARPRDHLGNTRRGPAPPPAGAPASPRTLRKLMPITVAETNPLPDTPPSVAAAIALKRPASSSYMGRVSRGAWLTLGASLSVATLVLVAWISRLGGSDAPAPVRGQLQPAAAVVTAKLDETHGRGATPHKPDVPSANLQPPAADETRDSSQLVRAALPEQPNPDLGGAHARPADPPRPSDADSRTPRPTAEPEPPPADSATATATAELRVGTIPLGQVWIDGQAAGWSPVVVHLPLGQHTVAGGNTRPEVTRSVRLRAGETKRLVLHLEDDALLGEEAAAPTANR